MPRSSNSSFDGLPIDNWQGRMTGTFELEEDEVRASLLDTVQVAVVVVKSRNVKVDASEKGEVTATRWYKVTDFRVVDPELREILVERLGLVGTDTLFGIMGVDPPPLTGDPHPAEITPGDDGPLTGEGDDEDEVPEHEVGTPVDVDDVRRRQAEARAAREARIEGTDDGPKVGRFGEDPFEPSPDATMPDPIGEPEVPSTTETLGSVYDGSARKDKHLAAFMADTDA